MKRRSMAARLCVYALGIWLVSFGIVLCKKCGFGISPISCIPFVLEKLLPVSFGTLTMLFHLVNILLQMILTTLLTVWQPAWPDIFTTYHSGHNGSQIAHAGTGSLFIWVDHRLFAKADCY